MTAFQGLLSGIGHPLLGPDHLLFLLAIGFLGLTRPLVWILPLLAFALGSAALTQLVPLVPSWERSLVSLSLVVEGLIALNVVFRLLLPVIGLHGYLLWTIVGAEASLPLIFGSLPGSGILLLAVSLASQRLLGSR